MSLQQHHASQKAAHDHVKGDMPDKPPVAFLTLVVTIAFVIVFLVCIVSYHMTYRLGASIMSKTDTGMGNEARVSYIQEEDDYLHRKNNLNSVMEKMIEKNTVELNKLR